MKGTKNFIIQIDNPYNDTFKTESGVELYGNVDFTTERQSNRIAKVVGIPSLFKTEIKVGFEVLIDASPLYRQIYQGTKQWYQNVVDVDKNLYHLEKDMIVCYRENAKSDWIGFGENNLAEPLFEQKNINTTLLLPKNATEKKYNGKVKIHYANSNLKKEGVKNGDTLYMNSIGGIKYWLDGKEFWWIRNKDVIAKEIEPQFNTSKIEEQMKKNETIEDIKLNGSFKWKNGVVDSEVVFIPNN
jgi:co-chaperonin GroES (HSP10)